MSIPTEFQQILPLYSSFGTLAGGVALTLSEIPLASEQNQIKNGDKLSEGEEYSNNISRQCLVRSTGKIGR